MVNDLVYIRQFHGFLHHKLLWIIADLSNLQVQPPIPIKPQCTKPSARWLVRRGHKSHVLLVCLFKADQHSLSHKSQLCHKTSSAGLHQEFQIGGVALKVLSLFYVLDTSNPSEHFPDPHVFWIEVKRFNIFYYLFECFPRFRVASCIHGSQRCYSHKKHIVNLSESKAWSNNLSSTEHLEGPKITFNDKT